MSEDTNNSGNSTPPPATPPGIQVPESFYTKAIKPILGKLILAGVILILLIIVINIFLKSLKKDHTLELMNQKLELMEKERNQIIKNRELLESQLKTSLNFINSQHQRDSVIQVNIKGMYDKIDRIKLSNNEINKAIDRFGSPEFLEYYRKLPEPNDY